MRSPMIPRISKRPSSSAGHWPNADLLCLSWPEEFGGGGASVWEQTVVREEMWAHHEPRGAQYMGVNWVGPDHHAARHRGAAAQAPAADRARRSHLVPGLFRTRGRLRPGVAAHDRAAATATAGWSAGRRSGRPTPRWRSGASCWPAPRKGEKKQQGLTIFLVPMDDPAIQVRPIRCMMGPHHLNEVFFDDLRVTEADVLGDRRRGLVDRAGRDVLRAGRHRPLRAVRTAAWPLRRRCSATAGTICPPSCGVAGSRMLTHCRRARLLAYRVVSLQSSGRIQPGDAAAYRIAVTKLDQDSAEVLMEIAAEVSHDDPAARWFLRRGRGPLAVLAGLHGVVGQHRDAAHPAVPSAVGGREMTE